MIQVAVEDKKEVRASAPQFRSSYSEAELKVLSGNVFFSSYLHNKLAIFLMWMQKPLNPKPISNEEKQKLIHFLFDLQHHFMPPYLQHKMRHVYRWLKICVTKFPDVKLKHRLTAINMCEALYKAFGLELKFDGPGWRETVVQIIKKEMAWEEVH